MYLKAIGSTTKAATAKPIGLTKAAIAVPNIPKVETAPAINIKTGPIAAATPIIVNIVFLVSPSKFVNLEAKSVILFIKGVRASAIKAPNSN